MIAHSFFSSPSTFANSVRLSPPPPETAHRLVVVPVLGAAEAQRRKMSSLREHERHEPDQPTAIPHGHDEGRHFVAEAPHPGPVPVRRDEGSTAGFGERPPLTLDRLQSRRITDDLHARGAVRDGRATARPERAGLCRRASRTESTFTLRQVRSPAWTGSRSGSTTSWATACSQYAPTSASSRLSSASSPRRSSTRERGFAGEPYGRQQLAHDRLAEILTGELRTAETLRWRRSRRGSRPGSAAGPVDDARQHSVLGEHVAIPEVAVAETAAQLSRLGREPVGQLPHLVCAARIAQPGDDLGVLLDVKPGAGAAIERVELDEEIDAVPLQRGRESR